MQTLDLGDIRLNYRDDGDPSGAPVVFSNPLGTDLTLWDKVVPRLPPGLRVIRYDARGQGLSDCPPGPYSMGALVRDAERLIEALGLTETVFVGLSLGGMVAQGLAVKRLDLVRGMVLSNTAAKIATPGIWKQRVDTIRRDGLVPHAEAILDHWVARKFRADPAAAPTMEALRQMLLRQQAEGYAACAAAISGTDFYTPTSGLGLPTLAIAGSEDRATPPDLVRETADLIRGSRFHLIRGAGHLPCVETPEAYAGALSGFLRAIGHV